MRAELKRKEGREHCDIKNDKGFNEKHFLALTSLPEICVLIFMCTSFGNFAFVKSRGGCLLCFPKTYRRVI